MGPCHFLGGVTLTLALSHRGRGDNTPLGEGMTGGEEANASRQEAPDVHGLAKRSQKGCHPEAQHSQQE